MAKQLITTLTLGILLVLAVGYIGYVQYDKFQENKQITAYATYQQGVQYGYEQTVGKLWQQAVTCNAVPVTFQNQTRNMIAVECLQQQGAQQQNTPAQ